MGLNNNFSTITSAAVQHGGVPDAMQGETVKAWVVLKSGEQLNAKEIQDYCRTKLVV